MRMLPYSFLIPSSKKALPGVWPSNPVDGNLTVNGGSFSLNDGDVKTYHNISITNSGTLYINGNVQIGFTGSFTLDSSSQINGVTNQNGFGYDFGGNPQSYTWGPFTAPDGTTYSYTVTGAEGGTGGNDQQNIGSGAFQGWGFGGGGAADEDGATQGTFGSGGEGSSSNEIGGGVGGNWDMPGGNGPTWPFADGGNGGGGGGGGAGTNGSMLFLKGGRSCSIVSAAGSINFQGNPGQNGGNGGSSVNGNDAPGGGGAGAGGAGGFVAVYLPTALVASFNPTVNVSGGAAGTGGASGGPGSAQPGENGGNGQNGSYTVTGY